MMMPFPRTVRMNRYLKKGNHPLKMSVIRRYLDGFSPQQVLTLRYKGPSTGGRHKVLHGMNPKNCRIIDGHYYVPTRKWGINYDPLRVGTKHSRVYEKVIQVPVPLNMLTVNNTLTK